MGKLDLNAPLDPNLRSALSGLKAELRQEASSLFLWWQRLKDPLSDGFYDAVTNDNQPTHQALSSIILMTRLLWYYSAHSTAFKDSAAADLADRVAKVISDTFIDTTYGGLYWSLKGGGQVRDSHKQTYAQAFYVYASAEHYAATKKTTSLTAARNGLQLIEQHLTDKSFGGYIEGVMRDFSPLKDQRLSLKDLNAPKSMNTHLHVLEAYTRLHQVAPDEASFGALKQALSLILKYIYNPDTGHLRLFCDLQWRDLSHSHSFGHDIEASWLIYEAAVALGDAELLAKARSVAIHLAEVTLNQGLGPEGMVFYEFDTHTHVLDRDGEWWGQAEAMLGFYKAYELTKNTDYLKAVLACWEFVKLYHKPNAYGEWTWYSARSNKPNPYLAGPWKCPYHNGRMAILLMDKL